MTTVHFYEHVQQAESRLTNCKADLTSLPVNTRTRRVPATVGLLVIGVATLAAAAVGAGLLLQGNSASATGLSAAAAAAADRADCPTGLTPTPSGCLMVAAPGEWVGIPAGEYFMGSSRRELNSERDEVRHNVTLTRDFLLMSREVTQGQFERVMGYNPSRYQSCGTDCPVERVTWHEAAAYSNELSRREGLVGCYACTGRNASTQCAAAIEPYRCAGYRLPTEAEWEYSARAGLWPLSQDATELETLAWHGRNSQVEYNGAWAIGESGFGTHPVGSLEPNEFGLHDMLGNVWEWCHDRYGEYLPQPVTNPRGPEIGGNNIVRGGSWYSSHWLLRMTNRETAHPSLRFDTVGFRVARTLPTGPR